MKRNLLWIILPLFIIPVACNRESAVRDNSLQYTDNKLSEDEKAGGVMTPEIMWKFGRLGTFALSPDGRSVLYTVTDIDLATEARRTNIFKIPSSGGTAEQLTTEGGSSPQWFNNGRSVIYVNDGTLMVMESDGSGKRVIEGLKDFQMFSISPAENKILFTRRVKLDPTSNEKHNLPDARVRIIDDLMYRHWDSWSDYSYSHIFVASFNGKNISDEKDLMTGQKFESPTAPYFEESEIAWSPDGKYIAYTSKRLRGREDAKSTDSDIYLVNVSSGEEVNITEGNKGYDKYPVFSPDGTMIAYQSMERDGYESDLDRLFVYNIKSGSRTWITRGWTFDVENLTWQDNENIFFSCAYLGTTQVFKTSIITKAVDKVTEGIHELGPVSFKSGIMVGNIMSMSMAPELASVDISTGIVKKISSINDDIYAFIKMGKTGEKYIRTRDNKDMQLWIVYPPDFDPGKKYPAILFCNGGPQSTLGQPWSYRWNFQMMAAKGYVVICPNRRGNKGFGQAWKEQISGDWGGANINDYLDATDAMAKEPYIDADRMAAVGASYGGFSVFYLAGVHGGRFKAFISHCGTFNFTSWYGTTEELWFPDKDIEGAYWNMPKSYRSSPHLRVDAWDTPILITTGANDFRIPYSQSLEAFQAAQLHNIPSRLLFFEDESHWILKPQNSVIWQREFFEWLETYLR